MAAQWLLPGNKERDLIAPHSQAPTSAPKKRHAKSRRFGATALSFLGQRKFVGFVSGPVAFVGRKSSCM
jgi:hypothetical protein